MPVRATLFGALAYFVLPFDIIPDFLLGLGYTDDAAVLLAAFTTCKTYITDDHRAKARAWLLKERASLRRGARSAASRRSFASCASRWAI